MKITIISSDAAGQIDHTISSSLLSHLPNQVTNLNEADVVIVTVSWQGDFRFNERLNNLKKRYVLMCFTEYGWNAGSKSNLWGTGDIKQFGHLNTPEYAKFDDWVKVNPPALELKRELLKIHQTPTRLPVEWACQLPASPIQSKAEFDARPMEVFNCWGYSHPSRPQLHGQIMQAMGNKGIHVLDAWDQDGHFEGRTWATIHSPHYNRKPIEEILRWQQRAKISVSLHGAGIKCFRSTMESPVGAIMAMPDDPLSWSYDWVDGVNCIRLHPDFLFEELEESTQRDDLFSIYEESQKTIEKYRSVNYCRDYIVPAIEKLL